MSSVRHTIGLREVIGQVLRRNTLVERVIDGQIFLVSSKRMAVVVQNFILGERFGEEAELVEISSIGSVDCTVVTSTRDTNIGCLTRRVIDIEAINSLRDERVTHYQVDGSLLFIAVVHEGEVGPFVGGQKSSVIRLIALITYIDKRHVGRHSGNISITSIVFEIKVHQTQHIEELVMGGMNAHTVGRVVVRVKIGLNGEISFKECFDCCGIGLAHQSAARSRELQGVHATLPIFGLSLQRHLGILHGHTRSIGDVSADEAR